VTQSVPRPGLDPLQFLSLQPTSQGINLADAYVASPKPYAADRLVSGTGQDTNKDETGPKV
jgi:hypothetical protein